MRRTTEHCGQLDQTIFTTEKKERRIYSELRPDSDPMDGNWESGGCFLVWLGYLTESVYPLGNSLLSPTAEHFGQLDQTIFTTEKKKRKKNVVFIVNLGQVQIRRTAIGKVGDVSRLVGVFD